jgi:hypothetical protein
MCNWAVSAMDQGELEFLRCDTNELAEAYAARLATKGYNDIEIWERRYSIAAETIVTKTLPNGRQERLEVKADG